MSTTTPSEITTTSNETSNESSTPESLKISFLTLSLVLCLVGIILFIIYILYKTAYIFKTGLSDRSRRLLISSTVIINLISAIINIVSMIQKYTFLPNEYIHLVFIIISGILCVFSLLTI